MAMLVLFPRDPYHPKRSANIVMARKFSTATEVVLGRTFVFQTSSANLSLSPIFTLATLDNFFASGNLDMLLNNTEQPMARFFKS
jgi:hypothetical protein